MRLDRQGSRQRHGPMRSGNRGGRRSGNVCRRDHDGDVRLNSGVAPVRTQRDTDSAGRRQAGQRDCQRFRRA